MQLAETDQDELEMKDANSGGHGDYLAQMAREDAENADEEDMMDLELDIGSSQCCWSPPISQECPEQLQL